jgi:hypothetical protein
MTYSDDEDEGPGTMSTVKNSSRRKRDFMARTEDDRERLLSEMWCHRCMEVPDVIEEPQEFEGNGLVFLEGRCISCGATVVLEIAE